MRIKFYLLLFLLIVLWFQNVSAQTVNPNAGIIPAPVSIQHQPGTFSLSQETIIQADSINSPSVQFFTNYLLSSYHLKNRLQPHVATAANNTIILTANGAEGLPANGYRLSISPQQIVVAGKGAGLFYGIQSLIQLLPLEKNAPIQLPCLKIEDYPRFNYRGFMLDVSRHFFSVGFVKHCIDLMAAYKMNTFHWHLTDDQGWRMEIKKYPRLTQVGSIRAQSLIGNYHDRMPQQFDNTSYGGYYTQEQIRDVVQYAASKYITIIPEIEMPGHSLAALAAYPELSCDASQQYKVAETWGIFNNVYCPTEKTFNFLQDVLTEVMELFPGKYIHIGGDEVRKEVWQTSPDAQNLIKKFKLKNEHGLQSYFMQRMEKFVNSKGRSIIGWDEILEGGLAPNATVMSWRGEAGGIAAAQQHHNVIMTPSSAGLYLDHAQGRSDLEPLSIGNFSPLQKTYRYNPTPAQLTPEQQKYILGVQANLWTEYIATDAKAEYMMLPRLLAVAELGWTSVANKNYADFAEVRLPRQLAGFDAAGINYRVPVALGAKDTSYLGTQLTVNLKVPVQGANIYYTIDGYTPNETALVYTRPFTLSIPPGEYRELQTIVITPSGKRSAVTHTRVYNSQIMPGVAFQPVSKGAKYKLFAGSFTNTGQIDNARMLDTGTVRTFNTAAFKKGNRTFGVVFEGYFQVDTDGKYIFSTQSDDGSVMYIDNQLVVDNDGKHSLFEQSGEAFLQKGYHKLTLKYFDAGAFSTLRLFLTIPGKPKGELSADSMYN